MIDFCLHLKHDANKNFLDNVNESSSKNRMRLKNEIFELILFNTTEYLKVSDDRKMILVIGDLILRQEQDAEYLLNIDIAGELKKLKGFFYIIEISGNAIIVYTAMFNILPLYYCAEPEEYIIASKVHLIKSEVGQRLSISKRFILEQRLFNYPFFDTTIYNEINSVPANSYLELSKGRHRLVKHTRIEDYFSNEPIPWKQSINQLAERFLDTAKGYFPDEEFYLTFTGGFDGRTLTACAKHFNKKFKTFSFGAFDNPDLTIPLKQAKKIDVEFEPLYLEDDYIENCFYRCGTDLVRITDTLVSFLQIHFYYAAKILSKKLGYLVNGMFGSELMRALHISGQVTSRALVDFFVYDNREEWIKRLSGSTTLNYLNMGEFKDELESLTEDLIKYKTGQKEGLSQNHRFYKFIFEEAFRKYFGAQIVSQFEYLKTRSPFLDFSFMNEFLKTGLAGANNEFFTHNPLKRYKGQLFYAKVIEKSYKKLLYLGNDKCYRPVDLIYPWGILNIAAGYFYKRIKRKILKGNIDNLRIISGIKYHLKRFESLKIDGSLFNGEFIRSHIKHESWVEDIIVRDKFVEVLSLINYLNNCGVDAK